MKRIESQTEILDSVLDEELLSESGTHNQRLRGES
jgi:hypothetical protein